MYEPTLKRDVLPFPAELRNMIYRYLVRNTYLVDWPSGVESKVPRHDAVSTLSNALAEFGLLHVSRAIRKEALALLYSESTFRYRIDRSSEDSEIEHQHTPLRIESENMMQNIELQISVPNLLSDIPPLETIQKCQKIVAKLNNPPAPRDSMTLKLDNSDAPHLPSISTPLFQTLAELTMFRTLTVEIYPARHQPNPDENIPLARLRSLIQSSIAERITQECEITKQNVKRALEPTLGPVVEEGEVEDAHNVCYARYIKFNPQRFRMPLF